MILGIGTDLANIDRIAGTIARFGDRFLNRVFTDREQAKAQSRPHNIAATYAKRWAAKEACSKALGTGLRMGIKWKDMAVTNLPSGQPVMQVSGWAAERLAAMTPPRSSHYPAPDPDRRSPLGAGLCGDRGAAPRRQSQRNLTWPRHGLM